VNNESHDRTLVAQLLSRARQRSIAHLLLEQTALALAIAMGGAIVLLLMGTSILDWYWVALIAAIAAAVALYRFRRTVPSKYKIAQRIDRRLNLADALSTATYFASDKVRADEAICQRQRAEADAIARTVDVRAGVPFERPRFLTVALALVLVAFGLFAVRFAITKTLSLQPSLVKMALDTLFPIKPELAKNRKPNDPRKSPDLDQGDPDAPTTQNEQQPETTLDPTQTEDQQNADATDTSKSASKQGSQSEKQDQQAQGQEKSDKAAGNQPDNNQQGDKDGKQGQQSAKDGKQANGNESSSMMDKLRDAMANMLNKMKQSSQSNPQNAQNGQQNQQQSGQQNKDSKGQQSQKQDAKADSQSDQQSEGADQGQTADAKGQDKASDKNASSDSKSGIGSADGDKAAKEAEELRAMGKISEILGKRSANVTGEVMVEVGSTKQQLKTPWAQKQAQHVDAGSEIHRDEVPLMYQQFVQQYFEEIHKAAPAAKGPAAAKPGAKPNTSTAPKEPGNGA